MSYSSDEDDLDLINLKFKEMLSKPEKKKKQIKNYLKDVICKNLNLTYTDNFGGGDCMVYSFLISLWNADTDHFHKFFPRFKSEDASLLTLSQKKWKRLVQKCRNLTAKYMRDPTHRKYEVGRMRLRMVGKNVSEEKANKVWDRLIDDIQDPGEWYTLEPIMCLFQACEVNGQFYICKKGCTEGDFLPQRIQDDRDGQEMVDSRITLYIGNWENTHFVSLLPPRRRCASVEHCENNVSRDNDYCEKHSREEIEIESSEEDEGEINRIYEFIEDIKGVSEIQRLLEIDETTETYNNEVEELTKKIKKLTETYNNEVEELTKKIKKLTKTHKEQVKQINTEFELSLRSTIENLNN
jgi:hypothetical protein